MAGITDPRRDIHVVEPYDPFAYKELHHLEGLLLADKGQAPRLVEQGFWDRDTETGIPSSPSGGLLGVGNPIAAAGMMKLAEIYWQLQGEAGPRQVKREVRRGLAQGWGDLMQVGTVVIMGK
jgi:acetyl-CoA C-acetyltransferase